MNVPPPYPPINEEDRSRWEREVTLFLEQLWERTGGGFDFVSQSLILSTLDNERLESIETSLSSVQSQLIAIQGFLVAQDFANIASETNALPTNYTNETESGGAGADVTPNAVNWADVSQGSGEPTTTDETLTGFEGTITIKLTYAENSVFAVADILHYYRKNSGSWTNFSSGQTVNVVAGDTLGFKLNATPDTDTGAFTYTIRNQTDSSTVLDTFELRLT